jgi:hypothetical protein
MSESFIHYLWQYQYYNKQELYTTQGESIQVIHPGYLNHHAGPDFQQARVRIGSIDWVGAVEIHIHASGWRSHRHDEDAAYNNVVLHVVWREDKPVQRHDGTYLPTLELGRRVDDDVVWQYRKLVNSQEPIPCAPSLPRVPSLTVLNMLDRTVVDRLELKAKDVLQRLKRNNGDWEETCYQLLARNFGFKVNHEPFEQLAQGLPYKVILKQSHSLEQVEALLFGQAGFLTGRQPDDEYLARLRREYSVLAAKYNLAPRQLARAQWRFLRLRPANFPTVRIAQFAALLFTQKHLFSQMLEREDVRALKKLFSVQQSVYWQHHYLPGKRAGDAPVPAVGLASIENIIINTVAPLVAAYRRLHDEDDAVDRAMGLLQAINPEENHIVTRWAAVGMRCGSAFDSQALLALHNNFCLKRRCLDCNIGFSLLNPTRRE